MELNISDEWIRRMAAEDDGGCISVGGLFYGPEATVSEEFRMAAEIEAGSPITAGNLAMSPPKPTGPQLGAYFGEHLANHKPGRKYEVKVIEPNGMSFIYCFIEAAGEQVAFQSMSCVPTPVLAHDEITEQDAAVLEEAAKAMIARRQELLSWMQSFAKSWHQKDWWHGLEFVLWAHVVGEREDLMDDLVASKLKSLSVAAGGWWTREVGGDFVFLHAPQWRKKHAEAAKKKEAARRELLEYMWTLSQRYWCAGWATGLEFDLWGCASSECRELLTLTESVTLLVLSLEAGGWWYWDKDLPEQERVDPDAYGEKFIHTEQWLKMYENRER